MTHPILKAFLAVAVASMLAVPALVGARAQSSGADATPPSLLAIQGARIVVAPGNVIESGTIVMEDGTISAVGADVDVPEGAWIVDGTGMTVYPGLVDALSAIGLPDDLTLQAGRGGRGGGRGAPAGPPGGGAASYSWGPEDRPATFTWISAADELDADADDDTIEAWRNGGFTSAVVAPEPGFFSGQASWVNLGADRNNRRVVAPSVAMRLGGRGGPTHSGYPGSLLGVIAYWRQTFIDAAWYDQAWSVYRANPAGLERPEYDRALETLAASMRAGEPVLFPGNASREIQRALELGSEVGVQPVIYGGQEAYRIPDSLRDVTVLINADWPDYERDSDPNADIPLATMRLWEWAPTSPAALEAAGGRFAFYSGEASASDFLANVRKAVDLGLSSQGALRALTTAPAEIFGVADRVGTLEPGKIANVIVTDGDLFDPGTRVRQVFVDGRKYDVPERGPAAGRGGRGAQAGAPGPGQPEGQEEEVGEAPEREAPQSPADLVPITSDRGPLTNAPVTLIRNATVLTITNGTIEGGSILIRDGRIAEVGTNIEAPAGALVIDATGQYVMPGIIDAHSHIAADAINEGTVSVSAMVSIRDVLNPDDVAIYRALAGGVTAAHILHGSANTIGGQNQLIKMRWGADAAGLVFEGALPTIKFALGENVTRDRNPDRYPATRMGVQDVVRQAFIDAREYQREWREYEAAGSPADVVPPRRDLEMEALSQVLDGTRVIHAHSYRADEILQLMRAVEEFGVHVGTFQHVLEGYKVADEMAAHGAMASTFSDWWAYKVEAYDAIPYNAALMTERGIVVSINSDDAEEMRHLNQEAAKTMRWGGLTENQALRLITINPALQVGVDDRAGSIEVGKDADLAIFSAHPLSVYAVVEKTIVDGQVYFDREEDARRQMELEAEKQALLQKHRRTPAGRDTEDDAETDTGEEVP